MKSIEATEPLDRPREKLHERGVASLSDQELLAVVLGTGSRKVPVHMLAERIMKKFASCGGQPTPKDLMSIEGVGEAKAAQLCAAMEFARRRIKPKGLKIQSADDYFPLVRHYADRKQEHFICTTLNGANEPIQTRVVTVGLVNESMVHPREVFADAITDRAASIIVAHNHPSGDPTPSDADIAMTRKIEQALDAVGIT